MSIVVASIVSWFTGFDSTNRTNSFHNRLLVSDLTNTVGICKGKEKYKRGLILSPTQRQGVRTFFVNTKSRVKIMKQSFHHHYVLLCHWTKRRPYSIFLANIRYIGQEYLSLMRLPASDPCSYLSTHMGHKNLLQVNDRATRYFTTSTIKEHASHLK